MNINDTFGKRYNIPVSLLSREDNLWCCCCHLKKLCVNPVRKEVTAVSKRLGEDGYGRGQVTFQESCGSMVQIQLQPPLSKWTAWSKCVSVCLVYWRTHIFNIISHFIFWGGGRENIINLKETGKIARTGACGGRRLRTDLQCIWIWWRHLKQNDHFKFPSLKKDKR